MATTATVATVAPQTEPDTNVLPNSYHSRRRPPISKFKMRFQGAVSHSPFSAQPNSLTRRLQALLPTASSNNVPVVTVSIPPPTIETTPAPSESPFVKIRIVTWNMHESLPKGDLDALLGVVPHYAPKGTPGNTLNIESLSMDASHPYHIVVIAGQECPTMMGLPMGLGGGFKWSKDDDEKEKEHKEHKEKEHKEKEGHKPKSTKDKDLEKDERRHSSEHIRTFDAPLPAITSTPTPSIKEKEKEKESHAVGWSSILEDYFSRGTGALDTRPALSTPVATTSTSKQVNSKRPTSSSSPEHLQPPNCPTTPGSNNKNVVLKPPQGGPHVPHLGPYELITKERMMGLYLAVYVHRDSGDLVHGHSKSAVTAGLIGGRLGNKGGVGISINFNGTSFLFINAHLAAHEGRKAHRLANMTKIKAELTVDPFLQPDDPRAVAEDITDRFDHTFIFGDLNFRLDVTRLHADWLVSRQEFVQAQEFDQLRHIMKRGEAFVGFNEAPIDFPPTFKYDVLRTIKQKKSPKANSSKHTLVLSEVEEKKDTVEDEPEQEGGDSVSVLSSAWASNLSRATSHSSSPSSESGKAKEEKEKETEEETDIAAVNPQLDTNEANEGSSGVSGIFQAAHRVKVKWLSLANSSTPSKESNGPPPPSSAQAVITRTKSLTHRSPIKKNRRPSTLAGYKVPVVEKLSTRFAVTSSVSVPAGDDVEPVSASLTAEDTPRKSTSSFTTEFVKGSGEVVTKIARNISRSSVTRKRRHNRDVQNMEVLSKGIYDSSSKRRVPSWCDRILYKSTVIPPPDPEPEPATPTPPLQESPSGLLRSGQRVGQFLANAFKTRNRRESVSSVSTTAINAPNTSPNGSPALNLERRGSGPRGQEKPLPAIPVPMEMSLDSTDSAGASFSALKPPVHNNGINSKRRSTDPVHGATSAGAPPDLRRRSASGPLPAVAKVSSPGPPALPMPELDPQPVPAAAGPRRWFSLQFLSAIHSLHSGPSPATRTSQAIPPMLPPPRHRKGDMVCIAYETLSDKEMRRLEGRSDHRPVIGHYAVFV